MNKRGNGEGEIRLRPDGRWEARLRLGDGKRKSIFGKTRKDVQVKLDELKHNVNHGVPVLTDERLTLGEYMDGWVAKRKAEIDQGLITYGYWRRLEEPTRKHIKPALGNVPLTKLTIRDVEQLYAQVLANWKPNTVAKVQNALRKALNDALRQELIVRNVAALARLDKGRGHEMQTYTPEESVRIREAARGNRYEAAIVLFNSTAARLGEILGACWPALDLNRGTLEIVTTLKEDEHHRWILGAPKTEKSRRTIYLTDDAIQALHEHHARQLEERLQHEVGWNPLGLIFCSRAGTTLNENNFRNRDYARVLIKARVRYINPHSGGRHTVATQLRQAGASLSDIQALLGHSSVATTNDIYAHVPDGAGKSMRDMMQQLHGTNPEKLA